MAKGGYEKSSKDMKDDKKGKGKDDGKGKPFGKGKMPPPAFMKKSGGGK